MNRFYKLVLPLFLLPLFSMAQSNYKPGYVVTLKGDTIRGFIDYQAWDTNPTTISFKSAISDRDKKTFGLDDVSVINVDKLAAYKKYDCKISMDVTNSNQLGEGKDTSFRAATVFLKVLQQGKNVALYSYTDDLKTRFYIGDAPDYTPVELVFRIYYDLAAQVHSTTIDDDTYKKQLFALANKYNSLDDHLSAVFENATYNQVDMIRIVSRINNISKTEIEKNYSGHSKLSWYVGAILNISKTTSDAGSSYTAGGGVPSTSSQPGAVFGLDLVPDPNGGRAEFRFEFSLNPSRFNARYTLKVSPYDGAVASYNQLGISFAPQALFNIYNARDFKFYLGFGATLTYFDFSNAQFHSQNPGLNDYFPKEPYYFNKLDNAFLLKAGFRIHRNLEIYFNYLTGTATTGGGYFALGDQLDQVGVSYFFNRK